MIQVLHYTDKLIPLVRLEINEEIFIFLIFLHTLIGWSGYEHFIKIKLIRYKVQFYTLS